MKKYTAVGHPPKYKPKGASFKGGYDLLAPAGSEVRAPFDAKIPHVYRDKTQDGSPESGSVQITLGEEVRNAKGDPHLAGFRVFVAHFVPVMFGPPRHVKAGDLLGHLSGNALHVSANRPDRLDTLI